VASLAVNGVLTLMFVYLMDLAGCKRTRNASVSSADVLVAVSFLCLTLGVGWREITDAICNDQFYHMQIAFAHSQQILAPDILPLSSALGQQLLHAPYRVLLYVINVFVQILLLLSFVGLNQMPRRRSIRAVAAATLFWLLR